jgi:hypothetical protein
MAGAILTVIGIGVGFLLAGIVAGCVVIGVIKGIAEVIMDLFSD